ncbi:hypothetical protein M011DRAFT_489539 [Sporormia fimetaria CBS 119925]|uniref:Uncharacterized protein n=1 Tax=Sporormia fimetaria CBS 119925 TaxID=1340428 RepID=A0A6A6UZW5_9PLEO|nr:hypothetical protein M011DRAFT_489539 [Sporormia fimetaria CBS 119925]
MSLRPRVVAPRLLVCCAFLLLPKAAPTPFPFQARGSPNATAQNWNTTVTSALPSSVGGTHVTAPATTPSPTWPPPYLPSQNGTTQAKNASATGNSTEAACTVYVPSASIDWWFEATYLWPVGTFFTVDSAAASGYGLNVSWNDTEVRLGNTPQTTPFDVTSALNEPAYTPTSEYDEFFSEWFTYPLDYTISPTAASTSVITRTAYAPLPTNNIVLEKDVGLYETDPALLPPATVDIMGANRTVFVATSTTPVIFFSAYEIESPVVVIANDGALTLSTVTQTYQLPEPYAYSQSIKAIHNSPVAQAPVPSDFLARIPHSSCAPGTLTGTVTVLVIVDLVYSHVMRQNPFRVHIEQSVLGFEDDTVVVQASKEPSDPFYTPRVEVTVEGFASSTVVQPAILQTPYPVPGNQGQGPPALPNAPEPTATTVGTIGLDPVVIGPSSVVVVGSQTLSSGSQITVGGNIVSLNPAGNSIAVGTITSSLPRVAVPGVPPPPPPPIITVGRSTLTPNAATQFSLAPGQTLTPGGQATLDGTVVSLAPSASFVVVGGSTQYLPPAPAATPPPVIVVGGSTFTQSSGSSFVIGSQTLRVGQPITVDSTVLSLGPSFVVINQATSTFAPPVVTPAITLGFSTIAANPAGAFVVSGQTLSLGGQAITVGSGTVLSLAAPNVVVVNGVSSTLAAPVNQITPPPIALGGAAFTALPGTGATFVISGQTLTPGGIITVSGTTVSLAPGATAVVIDGQTTYLTPTSPTTLPPILTIGDEIFLADARTTFIIDGQTLYPGGPAITVDGTTISLAPGATQLVVESMGRKSTTMLFPAATTEDATTRTDGPSAGGFPTGLAVETGQSGAERMQKQAWLTPVLVVMGMLVLH